MPEDIRQIPSRELCARFRAKMAAIIQGHCTDADRTDARTLYREIELRLVPTTNGSPRQ